MGDRSLSRGGGGAHDIAERTFSFALRVLRLVRALPRDTVGAVVARQLARSGTGIGSNVEEAQDAHTKKEFIRKMNIARGEARETLYWLRLIREAELVGTDLLTDIIRESDELVRILVTIVKRARGTE